MRIAKDFLNDIKFYNKDLIVKKLTNFEEEIKKSNCINEISKGFWIRRIVNTDIYKFRINSGDRILFTFDRKNNNELVFLKYCSHDKQIVKGKSINENLDLYINESEEINLSKYDEDEIDINIEKELEQYIKTYMSKGLENLISIVFEDEYIALTLQEDSDEYLYCLNESQFECLKILGKPIIISGCAGSGKTMVGIHKLLLNNEINLKSAYITYSPLLKNQAEKLFDKFNREKYKNVDFICINQFFAQKLNINYCDIINYNRFEVWFLENYSSMNNKILDTYVLYNEINKKNIYKKMYRCDEYKDNEIKFINKIYRDYEAWVSKNKYIDEIRLSQKFILEMKKKTITLKGYDFIFVDEIQDLTELHLEFINNILNIKENVIFSGDINQIINGSDFKFSFITKSLYENNITYEEKYINKNYRNTSGVVNLINKLIDLRVAKVGKSKKEYDQYEKYIRDGKMPYIIPYKKEILSPLFKILEDRDYCAVVVPTYAEKNKLINEGANKDRIFTINEIKGLEYKNIFCINFISANKDYWKLISKGENRFYLRHFFNLLYVAITRGINIVTFIEEDLNISKKILGDKYLNSLNQLDTEELELNGITSIEDWLKEAERLEDAMDYQKAYNAYQKANNREGIDRCRSFIDKINDDYINELFGYKNETAIRIEKDYGTITYDDVYYSLQKIFNKHCITGKGNVDVVFQDRKIKGKNVITTLENLNENNIIESISSYCEQTISKLKNIKKNKVTMHINFYFLNTPKRLCVENCENVNLIRVDIHKANKNKTKILLKYEYLESLNMSSMLKQIGMNSNSDTYENIQNNNYENEEIFYDNTIKYVNYLMKKASEYMNRKNYNEAIKYYNTVLDNYFEDYINEFMASPDKVQKYINSLKNNNDIEISNSNEFESYLRSSLYHDLGMCYSQTTYLDKAYEYLIKSLEYSLEPKTSTEKVEYSNTYLKLGDIFVGKHDYNKAYDYFKTALKLGNNMAMKGMALIKFKKGKVRAALEVINKHLDTIPYDTNGHLKRVEYFTILMVEKNGLQILSEDQKEKYYIQARESYRIIKTYIDDVSNRCELVKIFEDNFIN